MDSSWWAGDLRITLGPPGAGRLATFEGTMQTTAAAAGLAPITVAFDAVPATLD